MFKLMFLIILCVHLCDGNNQQIWNQVAVDKSYSSDITSFFEITLFNERQCFGQCAYNSRCFSFEVFEKASQVIECRLFDFVYESYSNTKSMVVKVGSKVHSKAVKTPKSCLDVYRRGYLKNGVYEIDLFGTKRNVYCYMEGEGGGWMAFQMRFDGTVSFEDKEWGEYKDGFGNDLGEYWLGLKTLHKLTTKQSHDLYVRAMDFGGQWESKRFKDFTIGPEEPEKYKFDYQSAYSGNQYSTQALFVSAKGMKFSTPLHDNNRQQNCGQRFPGGWWFNSCHLDFMNGKYSLTESCGFGTGIHWYHRFSSLHYCLKETILMIRPN